MFSTCQYITANFTIFSFLFSFFILLIYFNMNIGVKLSRLNREDFIWIIYLFIALFALLSDKYERDYLLHNNLVSHKKFKTINITILIVAFFIYLYFVLINYEDIKSLRCNITKKEVITHHASLVAALLFLVGGLISIWVEINRDTPLEDVGII